MRASSSKQGMRGTVEAVVKTLGTNERAATGVMPAGAWR